MYNHKRFFFYIPTFFFEQYYECKSFVKYLKTFIITINVIIFFLFLLCVILYSSFSLFNLFYIKTKIIIIINSYLA